jgi:amidohydrolase
MDLKTLRQQLHQHPELAFQENKTVAHLSQYIQTFKPDQVIQPIAQTGVAFVFKGDHQKPRVMFRAELDALPIAEPKNHSYRSKHDGVSHSCGHDGHMTMVAGIASRLHQLENRGDVILFFQPAEEVGEGAKKAMEDSKFIALSPDYIFGLHNLPEESSKKIVLRNGTFACSSVGLKINIAGASAHAAYPDEAHSPFTNISKVNQLISDLNQPHPFFLTTLTYLKLGEPSFGITPGHLEMYCTLRALTDEVLKENKQKFIHTLHQIFKNNFTLDIEENDYFPATTSWDACNEIVEKSAHKIGLPIEYMQDPIRWSEDFGYYTQKIPGAFFGLGLGIDTPLHHQSYDFNDDVLEDAVALYIEIIRQINRSI